MTIFWGNPTSKESMCTQPSRRHLLRWCVCVEHTNRHVLKSQNTHVIKSHYRRWLIELRGGVDKISRINERGVWNKVRVGWQIPQKLINGRARLLGTTEYLVKWLVQNAFSAKY